MSTRPVRAASKRTLVPLVPTVLSLACGSGAAPAGMTVRDSAGVQILENAGPVEPPIQDWRVAPQPVLSIGATEADAVFQFSDIAAVLSLRDGRIVVGDESNTIRYFTADGQHVTTSGRTGEGPGEFGFISSLHRLPADSVLVVDQLQRRATIFDADGAFASVRSFGVDGSRATQVHPFAGRLAGLLSNQFEADPGTGLQRAEAAIVLSDDAGTWSDTLVVVPGLEWASFEVMGQSGVGSPPFARRASFTIFADQLYVGTGDFLAVDVYSASGQHVRSMRVEADLQITDADRLEAEQNILAVEASEQYVTIVEEMLKAVPYPPSKSAYRGFLVDELGNVWLAEYSHRSPQSTLWYVFATDGAYLGTITVPERFEVHEIGEDYLLGAWQDEFDVEHVQRYRIDKSAMR